MLGQWKVLPAALAVGALATGGAAYGDQQITTGNHSHYSAAWSPDQSLIYTQTVAAGDTVSNLAKTVTSGGAPTFMTSGTSRYAGVDVSTSGQLLFTVGQGAGMNQVAWMPAGGGSQTMLTSFGFHSAPVFAPNGSRIAYMKSSQALPDTVVEVWVRPFPSGSESRWATGSTYLDPQWSPDGTRLSCIRPDAAGYLQIFVLNGPGSETQLTSLPHHHLLARWAPDGSRLAYERWLPGSAVEIWTVTSGGQETLLVGGSQNHGFPIWSPDGEWVYYQIQMPNNRVEIHAARADGSQTMVVTAGNSQRLLPVPSPSGDRIAYLAYSVDTPQVWTADFNPTAVSEHAPEIPAGIGLRVSPNPFSTATGADIAFSVPAGEPVRVTIHDAAGRLVRELAAHDLNAPGWQGVTWDGRTSRGRQAPAGVYTVRVATGRESAAHKLVLAP